MRTKDKKQPLKKEETCKLLSEREIQDLARYIINEVESSTDISRGTTQRRKRLLPTPSSVMIF